jgi:ribosomal protein L37E
MGHFQVLFSGELVPGSDPAQVRRGLAAALSADPRKLHQLFSGRTVVLRSELGEEEALQFQAEMESLGARTRIKNRTPITHEAFNDRARGSGTTPDLTLKDITAAHFECPRCGFLQLEAEHCARCGVNIAQAMREHRKEDLVIEKRIRELRARKARTAAQHGRRGRDGEPGRGTRPPGHIAGSAGPGNDAGAAPPPRSRAGAWLRSLLPIRPR